jgi:glycosyltransferase involved in cell wall biosynthesis
MNIYLCTVVANRWDTFQQLLRAVVALEPAPAALCVYDWNSTDADLQTALIAAGCPYKYYKHNYDEPLNRAAARNKAFALAAADPDDIVFFVDCDMVVPPDFVSRIQAAVCPGRAYFPVCYSLYRDRPQSVFGSGPQHSPGRSKAHGWWRHAGRGNCGFVARDFTELGGWATKYGARYGKEDDDIFTRASKKLTAFRDEVPGFFHLWHPKLQEPSNVSMKKRRR